MVNKCDICGGFIDPNARFCGSCGVDLREPKRSELPDTENKITIPTTKKSKAKSKKNTEEGDVIHWHAVRALCNSYQMSFSDFFYLVILLGKGDKQLGFCDCASCNQGYRELLAAMTNATEKKNLTAQSREIVIKSREDNIEGFKIDFSRFLQVLKKNNDDEQPSEKQKPDLTESTSGKIIIELDPCVIENAIITVLKSARGQEIIQSIPRKRGRPKKS